MNLDHADDRDSVPVSRDLEGVARLVLVHRRVSGRLGLQHHRTRLAFTTGPSTAEAPTAESKVRVLRPGTAARSDPTSAIRQVPPIFSIRGAPPVRRRAVSV